MASSSPVSALMLGALIVVLLIVGVLLFRFMSKSRNRHPMDGQRERNIDEIRRETPRELLEVNLAGGWARIDRTWAIGRPC